MNTYEKPLKVLVCGTNFGRVYLKGLERCGDKFKIPVFAVIIIRQMWKYNRS